MWWNLCYHLDRWGTVGNGFASNIRKHASEAGNAITIGIYCYMLSSGLGLGDAYPGALENLFLIARPVESPTEKVNFRSVHYNRPVYQSPISLRKLSITLEPYTIALWNHRWAQLISNNENSCSFRFWIICPWSVCVSVPNLFAKSVRPQSVSENWPNSSTIRNILINFAYTTRSSPRDCQMLFVFGRGFTEVQILKKWNWSYLLNRVEYFDEILHVHWYWQNLAQWNAKCHLLRSKFRKRKVALSIEPRGIFW